MTSGEPRSAELCGEIGTTQQEPLNSLKGISQDSLNRELEIQTQAKAEACSRKKAEGILLSFLSIRTLILKK